MRSWKQKNKDKEFSATQIATKTVEELQKAHSYIEDFLEFKASEKLDKTYIAGTKSAMKFNGDKKVYPVYRFDGTVTGRLSCASYTVGKFKKGVSFHTLPRGENDDNNIRSIFTAPKGWAFITSDYSGMELRVLSHIAKEVRMQKAFTDGLDLHTYSASLAFGKPYDKVSKDLRQIAKAVSFLIVYGGSAFTLSKKHGLSIKKAERIIEQWFAAYPAVPEFMDFVNDFIRENGYAYSLFGRRRHLENVYSQDDKVVKRCLRQGLNFTIQSPASDILLCALLGITKEFKKRKLKARICATVHDSLEAVCPVEELWEAESILRDYMISNPIMKDVFGLEFSVPFEVETLVGHSFGDGVELHFDNDLVTNMDEVMEYLNVA
tara:strand:- start:2227 stop:3360 length:1134 start_codon:yes stop_codon:yes gene_type:complete